MMIGVLIVSNKKPRVAWYHCCKCPHDRLMPKAWHSERDKDGNKIFFCARHWAEEKKKRNPEKVKATKLKSDQDERFFQYVWDNSNKCCTECGKVLGEFKRWYVHHILAKATHPYFRYEPKNVIILCYQHHNEIESAISAPKLKVYAHCEKVKKTLLESVGMNYENKSEQHT